MKIILELLPQASPNRIILSTKLKMAALSNVANTLANNGQTRIILFYNFSTLQSQIQVPLFSKKHFVTFDI